MLAIDDLISPPTEDQTLETFLTILETLGIGARSWRKGGVARTILRVVAKSYVGFALVMAEAVRSGFLESARGPWLTLLARNVFDVARVEATFASGQIQLTNTGGGVYSQNADTVRFLWLDRGKAYTNVAAFTLNALETKLIDIRAVEVGNASSAPPGAIDTLETNLPGVVVSNPESVVGSDEESDEELRAACRAKLGAISVRGPRGAYAYAVTRATRLDGSPVDINRYSISPSSSTGTVTVTVASPSGAPAPSDMDRIREKIEEVARPDSVTAIVQAASEVPVTRTLTVWARRVEGISAADIEGFVGDALVAAIAEYPVGGFPKLPSTQGYLYADYLVGVAKGAHSSIFDIDGAGADVALAPNEVATLATTIDVRVIEVP